MKFSVDPKKLDDKQEFTRPSLRPPPISTFPDIKTIIIASSIIAVILMVICVGYYTDWFGEEVLTCPNCTCPTIPACPTCPTIPACPSCPACTITSQSSSLSSMNQTCIGFDQIVNVYIYNSTDDYNIRRMEYDDGTYEYELNSTDFNILGNVTKIKIKIGG